MSRFTGIVSIIVAVFTLFGIAFQTHKQSSSTLQLSSQTIARGSKTDCTQPPAHTDLTTLSNAQLDLYGLPPRPNEKQALIKCS